MNVSQFSTAVLGYFNKYLLSHIPEEQRFWVSIITRLKIETKIAEIIPMLIEAKVVNEAGVVDIDKLQKAAEETFKDVPKAVIGKFDFDVSDLPQFINFLKNGVNG